MRKNMNHQVFISYTESDINIANMICSALEKANIRCWIAPRDIPPGHRWGDLMFNAVEQSQILVLVLSAKTEESQWVIDELTLAMSKNKKIIPFQIEKFSPQRGIISGLEVRCQWINAYTQPLQDAIDHLVNSVRNDLDIEKEKKRVRNITEKIAIETSKFKNILRRKEIRWLFIIFIIALLLTITGFWKKGDIPHDIKGNVSSTVTENQLLMELQSKGLIEKIKNAKAFYDSGNTEGENQALNLYREVIKSLSQKARLTLNQALVTEADNDFKNKHYTHAVRKYKAVFEEYYQ